MTPLRRLIPVLIIACFLFVLFQPALARAANTPLSVQTRNDKTGVRIELQADAAPYPGGEAVLRARITPLHDAGQLYAIWLLPDGGQALEPLEIDLGPAAAGQPVELRQTVRFPAAGVYPVLLEARYADGPAVTYSDAAALYFSVERFWPRLSAANPLPPESTGAQTETTVSLAPLPAGAPASPDSDPCFVVQGTVRRLDGPIGYALDTYGNKIAQIGPLAYVPVRYALVEIREWDPLDDDSYGYAVTNADGFFRADQFCDDDGTNATLELYIRVRAEWRDPTETGKDVAEVVDISYIDETYEFDTTQAYSSGGTVNINVNFGWPQSLVLNIGDALYNAYAFWNASGGEAGGDPKFNTWAEAHYEPTYNEDETFYNSGWNEITISDAGDPSPLDDGVIMHEWGHMADDIYSCYENPGGDHSFYRDLGDSEFGWGEGYPDYYLLAVRQWLGDPNARYYFDLNIAAYAALHNVGDTGTGGMVVDAEIFPNAPWTPERRSINWEFSVASTLWDLIDHQNEPGFDTVDYTHRSIQNIYTSSEFEYNGTWDFDAQCDAMVFFREWDRVYGVAGSPDMGLANLIHSNLGFWTRWSGRAAAPASPSSLLTGGGGQAGDMDWWERVVYVVDTSPSKDGERFEAVRTVLTETTRLASAGAGAEFSLLSFNHDSPTNTVVVAGAFSLPEIQPAIAALETGGSENPAYHPESLSALGQAIDQAYYGQAWLFTDGTPDNTPAVEDISRRLQEHTMQASVALLAGSTSAPAAAGLPGQPARPDPDPWRPAARSLLGPAVAQSIDASLLPYVYTAVNSGGQFLYVSQDQLADAASVLLAQLTHTAGAGRWSDYVSTTPTYRWNDLPSWRYSWIDASAGGEQLVTPAEGSYVTRHLFSGAFPFYGAAQDDLNIWGDGYITLGYLNTAGSHINTAIPDPAAPNGAIYPYWDALYNSPPGLPEPGELPAGATPPTPPAAGQIWYASLGDWEVVQWRNFYNNWGALEFETKLNRSSGEIQFLYNSLTHGSESATIGVEDYTGSSAIEIARGLSTRPASGKGYQLIPAPARPSAVYSVTVDASMSSLALLATVFDGSLNWMAVTDPDGAPVLCVQPGVSCVDAGAVQYLQTPVSGRYGVWHVTFTPGKTGQASFAFSSIAISALQAVVSGSHARSTASAPFLVDLGATTDDFSLTGRLLRPDGSPFSYAFDLYDDGAHGDGAAKDGIFGSAAISPPDLGSAYLWLGGQYGGLPFQRVDPRPFIFSPLGLAFDSPHLANFGAATSLGYTLHNYGGSRFCVQLSLDLPAGWHAIPPEATCLDGGTSTGGSLEIYLAPGAANNLPSGSSGQVVLSAVEAELGEYAAAAETRITRRRQPATVEIDNLNAYLRPGGDVATLRVFAADEQGYPVADGTMLWITPTLGTAPAVVTTTNGRAFFDYISGAILGSEYLQVGDAYGHTDYTTLEIMNAEVGRIVLEAKKDRLLADGASTSIVYAWVYDDWGNPMPGQRVRISVNGDNGKWGQLSSLYTPSVTEVITGTTDSNGMFGVLYTAGSKPGVALLTAQLAPEAQQGVIPQNGSVRATEEILLWLNTIYLPVIRR